MKTGQGGSGYCRHACKVTCDNNNLMAEPQVKYFFSWNSRTFFTLFRTLASTPHLGMLRVKSEKKINYLI